MQEIRCNDCGTTLGTATVPSSTEIKRKAAGEVNPALLALLPPNVAEVILAVLTLRCPTCTSKEIFHNGSEEESNEESDDEEAHGWSPFRRRKGNGQ